MSAEKIEERPVTIESVLQEHQIAPLPSLADSGVVLPGINEEIQLTLEKALKLPREKLLAVSLEKLRLADDLSRPRHDGRKRSAKEKRTAREQRVKGFQKNGPGRIIAAIALNGAEKGKKAEWSAGGLTGRNKNWQTPSEEECSWWNWVYQKLEVGQISLDDLSGSDGELLHAYFIFRDRQYEQKGEAWWDFVGKVNELLDEESPVNLYLREITQKFS